MAIELYENRLGSEMSVALQTELNYQATTSIDDFGISFVLGTEPKGSGTLVDAFGVLGILTAHHVVREFNRHPDRPLFLVIDRLSYQFELPRACFVQIAIGRPNYKRGPDLSFLQLTGGPQIATLKSKKSFYPIRENPLEGTGEFSLTDVPFKKMIWWIAGAPAERVARGQTESRERELRVIHLIARADYQSRKRIGAGFDVIKLKLDASTSPFPTDYRGCSGGGVWVACYWRHPGMNSKKLGITLPLLVGVTFRQGKLIGGHRSILANGPQALRGKRIRKTLNRAKTKVSGISRPLSR
jgi:hypothetical protein